MIGQKIHNYQINAHLGQGGMGNVYRATDTMLGREVALKMLHPQLTMQTQFLERFKKEARVLAQLFHPNIAVIYNFIEQDGNHFMVMEYVEGTNLDDLLKRHGTLPAEFIVPFFIQVLEGLQHAHSKNIFHRDIKPSNLMLTPDGTVKLMDFGIAKVAGEQKMTQVNKIVGTVEFMAPELIRGEDASAYSDIYATGVTLYELVSGKLPFESDTDFNLMQAIMKQKVKPPEKLNASVPAALSDIVMKALDKNPENRYKDARAFQQALMSAFPHFREVNLATLRPSTPATVFASQPGTDLKTTSPMETRTDTWSGPGSVLEKIKQNVSKNRKWYLIAAALLLVLYISVDMLLNDRDNVQVLSQSDSLKQNGQNLPVANNTSPGTTILPQENVSLPPQERNNEIIIPPAKVENSKPKEKKTEKKEPVQKKEEDRINESTTPVEKQAEKKDIYIKSKVEVDLYLRENLENSPERQDIPVTFTVSNTVYYEGVAIINKGTLARGTIKLGKIQTDVEINTVSAANGQQIRLKALRGHGKRNTVSSDRNYTAIIQPGTRLSF